MKNFTLNTLRLVISQSLLSLSQYIRLQTFCLVYQRDLLNFIGQKVDSVFINFIGPWHAVYFSINGRVSVNKE